VALYEQYVLLVPGATERQFGFVELADGFLDFLGRVVLVVH
jgi:hypothetical protein